MKRIKLTIEYKGTAYSGWQRQANGVGVQQVVEEALSYVLNEEIKITGSGRTDEGVHAFGQVAHFDTETKVDAQKIALAANTHLPHDIRILKSEETHAKFNARHDAKRKTYLYKCYISPIASAVRFDTHYQIAPPVNLDDMRAAAKHFIGEHDFKAFAAVGRNKRTQEDGAAVCLKYPLSTVREIYELRIEERDGDEFWFYVTGNGFLYNMVRIIVRTLIEAGKGRIKPESIPDIILSKDRSRVKELAPAKGLYLLKIFF